MERRLRARLNPIVPIIPKLEKQMHTAQHHLRNLREVHNLDRFIFETTKAHNEA